MDDREVWLNKLSNEELLALSPWDIITTENAKRFLLIAGRGVLRKHSKLGLSAMPDDELLHEVYPLLCDAMPGILQSCILKSTPDKRDRFIFGCLAKLINFRLCELVFGSYTPTDSVYLEEISIGRSLLHDDDDSGGGFPFAHSLMSQYDSSINSYFEAHSSHEPQFLSDSACVPEQAIQNRHLMIEQYRTFLTTREVEVLRCMLLQNVDRSLVALEIGTTPKQVSRYRQSIQKKLKRTLGELGWSEAEIFDLVKKQKDAEPQTVTAVA
jgi:DNA-binding CsgD family transcriptional regulator